MPVGHVAAPAAQFSPQPMTPAPPSAAPPHPGMAAPGPALVPQAAPAPRPDSKLTYAVVFLGALSIVVSAGLLVRYFTGRRTATGPDGAPAQSAGPASTLAASAVGAAPAPLASASSVAIGPRPKPKSKPKPEKDAEATPSGKGAEAEARAALEKLRDGIETCVETHIGVLPGTSKPIPASFRMFLKGRYHSPGFVWKTPVFRCTDFSMTKPQPFMIQWQSEHPKTTGQGVAWLDDDGDGKPDRSLSFPARFKKRNEVEVGEVVVDETIRVTKRP